MIIVFFISALVAIGATFLAITRKQAVHALVYLVVSLLAVSTIFFILGAHLAAALEVIIYAGAIMVLFLFAVMMLNAGDKTLNQERFLLRPGTWVGPSILSAILLVEWLVVVIRRGSEATYPRMAIDPRQVGLSLFGTYGLGVELASVLLLAALVGALHLSKKHKESPDERNSDRV
ncbi:MAG: NADH-quinone oxidoreductase subunit J [Candidatus Omnitrophota bacterium]